MNQAEWIARVEETNAEFLAANRERKRVIIAKDVLAQLEMGRLVAASTYLTSDQVNRYYDARRDHINGPQGRQGMDQIPEMREEVRDGLRRDTTCKVCGIGALFVASLARIDALNVNRLFDGPIRYIIISYLEEHGLFTSDELYTIEDYFEGNARDYERELVGCSYPRDIDYPKIRAMRMKSIMQKIIELEGAELPHYDYHQKRN